MKNKLTGLLFCMLMLTTALEVVLIKANEIQNEPRANRDNPYINNEVDESYFNVVFQYKMYYGCVLYYVGSDIPEEVHIGEEYRGCVAVKGDGYPGGVIYNVSVMLYYNNQLLYYKHKGRMRTGHFWNACVTDTIPEKLEPGIYPIYIYFTKIGFGTELVDTQYIEVLPSRDYLIFSQ